MTRNIRKVVDASVMIALLNKSDKFHAKALDFFRRVSDEEEVQLVIPTHTLFEVNVKIRGIKNDKRWDSIEPFIAKGPEFYPITTQFLEKIQQEAAFDWLSKLGSQDAIYAAIAFIEKIPLVTFDSDFEEVKNMIQIELM